MDNSTSNSTSTLQKNAFIDASIKICDGLARLGHEISNNQALQDLGAIVADHFYNRAKEVALAAGIDLAAHLPHISALAQLIEKTPLEAANAAKQSGSFVGQLLDWADKQQNVPPGTTERQIKDGLGGLWDELSQQISDGINELFGSAKSLADDLSDYLGGILGGASQAIGDWGIDLFGGSPSSALDIAGGLVGTASGVPVSSPIVLDLDGDGISLVALEDSAAHFDLDNDGFREKTQWVAPTDGLLALDGNANGRIDDKAELFGDGAGFADGYAKLRTYDTNADNVIDASDAVFADLRIWQDADSDGYTDEDELKTLAELGIASLSLAADSTLSSTFTRTDGTTGQTQDAFFEHDQLHTIYGGEVNLAPEALFLPWLRGYGTVKDLPLAVSADADLLALVEELAAITNPVDLWSRMDELLAKWTGADSIDPEEMRGDFNSRKLAVLEQLTGEPYVQEGNGSSDAHWRAAPYLEQAYETIKLHFFGNFAAQTFWFGKYPDAEYNFALDRMVFPVDGDDLTAYLADVVNSSNEEEAPFLAKLLKNMEGDTGVTVESLVPYIGETRRHLFENVTQLFLGTYSDDVLGLASSSGILFGFAGNDTLAGGSGSDTLVGGSGNDNISAGAGNNLVWGGEGDDTLDGGADNDNLSGGKGRDCLVGGAGDDVLDGGDGADILQGGIGKDAYILTAGDVVTDTDGKGAVLYNGNLLGTIWYKKSEPYRLFDRNGNRYFITGSGLRISGRGGLAFIQNWSDGDLGVTVDLNAGVGRGGYADGDRYANIEAVFGSKYADCLTGDSEKNYFFSGDGDNVVLAGGGKP